LLRRAPDFDAIEWPEPAEADEYDDPLFDSTRDYVEQCDRFKQHQDKPTARRESVGNSLHQAAQADAHAERLRHVLAELDGMSATAAAADLNRRKVALPRGGLWHPATVLRMRKRLANQQRISD
jgi:hypothetical protein